MIEEFYLMASPEMQFKQRNSMQCLLIKALKFTKLLNLRLMTTSFSKGSWEEGSILAVADHITLNLIHPKFRTLMTIPESPLSTERTILKRP